MACACTTRLPGGGVSPTVVDPVTVFALDVIRPLGGQTVVVVYLVGLGVVVDGKVDPLGGGIPKHATYK